MIVNRPAGLQLFQKPQTLLGKRQKRRYVIGTWGMADESVSNGALARRKNLMSVFLCLTMRALRAALSAPRGALIRNRHRPLRGAHRELPALGTKRRRL